MKTKDLEAFTVFKDNRIIEAAYELTLVEQRLILGCLGQVYPVYGKTLSEDVGFKITADEYSEIFHVKRQTAIVDLQNGTKKLSVRQIYTEGKDGGFSLINWITDATYNAKEGLVELNFNKKIISYFTDLNKENCPYGYTKYKLSLVSKMTSPNSIRLYEIFVQKVGMGGERMVHIDWLRKQLCLGDKYQAFGSFKKFVLDPALKQIKDHSNLDITVKKTLKHTREIYGYVYDIKYKKGMEPIKQEPKAPEVPNETLQTIATDLAPAQTSQLPVFTQGEQSQVYKSKSNSNYGKKTAQSNIDVLLELVAKDTEKGMSSLGQHFIQY